MISILHTRHPSVNKSWCSRIRKKRPSSAQSSGKVAILMSRIEMDEPRLIVRPERKRGVDFFGDNRQPVHLIVLLLTGPIAPGASEILRIWP